MSLWKTILLKWDSLVLAIVTILFGEQLLVHPEILRDYEVYKLIDNLFDDRVISILLVIVGFTKLIGIIGNFKYVKRWSLVSLTFLWTLFGVSFLLSEPPNTVWIFSLSMAFISLGIAIREE